MENKPPISVVVEGFRIDDGSSPRVCAAPAAACDPSARGRSSFELFLRGRAISPNRPCLGYRRGRPAQGPYQWLSYSDVYDAIISVATSLIESLGLQPGQRVGIYGKNCPNWTIALLAASAAGLVVVPVYDTFRPDAVAYICNHAELAAVFVSEECLTRFQEAWNDIPTVQNVIIFGNEDISSLPVLGEKVEVVLNADSRLASLQNIVSRQTPVAGMKSISDGNVVDITSVRNDNGKATLSMKLPEPNIDALFVIMYTSGTTGRPKGVMLTNRALMSSCTNGLAFLEHYDINLTPDDSMFSFLPLAHIFAQQTEANIYAVGGRVGYYQGNVKLLMDDLHELSPTIFAGVPRVYARFQQKILDSVATGSVPKRMLFKYAYFSQLYNVRHNRTRSAIWDALVFSRVRASIFPRVRFLITGAAPMSSETNDFLKVVLNLPVLQGFGMTETLGGVACTPPTYPVSGTCGCPLPGVQVKLVSVPEMEYFTTDSPRPRGEVYVLSPTSMTGYYKHETETAIAFPNGDGWLATGDVGQWNADGALQIIDRKKNLFKLSQGEYVSPETLEQEYCKAKLVAQIFVYGNSEESCLVGIVVPDIQATQEWAEGKGGHLDLELLSGIVNADGFKQELLRQLQEIRKLAGFEGYEVIRDVHIECNGLNDLGQGFSVENDLLTPSFKLKRPQLLKKYREAINDMYSSLH